MTAVLSFFPLLSPEFLALQKYAVHRRFAFSFFQSLSRAAVSAGQKAGKIIESRKLIEPGPYKITMLQWLKVTI